MGRSFQADHGITLSSLFYKAQGGGWVDPQAAQEPPGSTIEVGDTLVGGIPRAAVAMPQPALLTVPGVLGEMVTWGNATAHRHQPQFAVQAALALGSVVLGRSWKSDRRNYSSLL